MFERLSGEFNRGYTRAIQDITDIFKYVNDDLIFHSKRMNYKLAMQLLKVILENREKLREVYKHGFIRWNIQKGDFEWFEMGGSKNE